MHLCWALLKLYYIKEYAISLRTKSQISISEILENPLVSTVYPDYPATRGGQFQGKCDPKASESRDGDMVQVRVQY